LIKKSMDSFTYLSIYKYVIVNTVTF
jgi:hypothetical protein